MSSTRAERACSSWCAASRRRSAASIPEAPPDEEQHLGVEAIHQELSRYRYCTVFLIEGEGLEREALEDQLEQLGD